ncbi:MAG: FAD-binding oxidoreductase [Bdellovibrionales bacterium]|nr:FAD-binding oxidoreductase [Bdellovibrionales bacterium]
MTAEARPQIAIIGAGVIGSALAMALAERGAKGVVVYDPDLEGSLSSSELNAGGVRATFHQPLNVLCSKLSIDYFAAHAAEVGYRACGYLWMVDAAGMARFEDSEATWRSAGWPTEAWDVAKLSAYAPFIDKTDDLAGAVFGPRDGLLNPNLLKLHFRERAKAAGATFVDRLLLRGAKIDGTGVELRFERLSANPTREEKESAYLSLDRVPSPGSVKESPSDSAAVVSAERVVNCAGPWAKAIARILGYDCPAVNVRRQISLFDCRGLDLSPYGMMIDPSGVYFHPEAGYILGGIAERDEPIGQNFRYGGEEFFQEKIWMPLSERSTKFEALRHLNGWGGLYEVSPDESAIIGEVETGAPSGTGRVFESHSYSGHGVMHSYACGVALAERMLDGKSKLLELEPFAGSRFARGHALTETAVI